MDKILQLLEKDSKLTAEQIAGMLGIGRDEAEAAIRKYEEEKVILGYKTMIDWEKTEREIVTALIEVRVTPQRGEGFDRVAARIYQYPEVDSVYLMSGGFDLTVIIEGRTMKEVAMFVAQKLAVMESVISTATHFVLKKYKDKGILFTGPEQDDKRNIIV